MVAYDDIICKKKKATSEMLFQEEAAEGAQLKPLKITAPVVCEQNV